MLLHRHFCGYVPAPGVRRILVHEENQDAVLFLNLMVSASKPMMSELRKFEVLMRVQGLRLEARSIASAVNKFSDSLSRTWNPGAQRSLFIVSC